MVYCLHPKVHHWNPDYVLKCQQCEYLIKDAQIDNYTINSFLGRGSFGDVYEVSEPPPLGRIFALKILRQDRSQDFYSNMFSSEAANIAKLKHPHILPIYKFGRQENDRPYFIMEYAAKTLREYFQKPDGSLQFASVEALVPFVEQAAQALHFIHESGYIHQDVKPVNILVKDDQLFLADFGTTYLLGMKTHVTLENPIGTYLYMSPEQLDGKPRRESDQYALAVELLRASYQSQTF